MGFPFSGGWAEQPFWIPEMIAMYEDAYNQEQAAKYNKDKKSSGSLADSVKTHRQVKTKALGN